MVGRSLPRGQCQEQTFCFRGNATTCNLLGTGRSAAFRAVAADFQPAHDDVEPTVAFDLTLEAVEEVALELDDLAATQAGHMNMIALRTPLVIMLLALHVHEVEFVDQPVAFEQFQGSIYRHPVNAGIQFAGVAQDLRCIQVLLCGFDDA